MAYHQFEVIGFVFTAKSIARYQKLDNTAFAEYYLLGTLFSMISAFIAAWICLL